MRFGSGKYENNVFGRLFQCFQKSVERRRRKHMRFIDYIHLISARNRSVLGVFFKLPNFFNAVVGSGVYFDNVNIPRLGKLLANLAFMAGRTVDGFKQLTALAKILAQLVLPFPRSVNKYE